MYEILCITHLVEIPENYSNTTCQAVTFNKPTDGAKRTIRGRNATVQNATQNSKIAQLEQELSDTDSGAKKPTSGLAKKVSDTKDVMNENKRMLLERGEKLNKISDNMERMEKMASNFADNAAKLRKKQNSFWPF